MTNLTPEHPAVRAAHKASKEWLADSKGTLPDDEMVYVLASAIPLLTSDNIRDTDIEREAMAEGWKLGEACGWGRAMRYMSDEPDVKRAANPFQEYKEKT